MHNDTAAPRETLSLADGLVMVIGMVVGIGVFATPSLVAQFSGSSFNYLALWLVGGFLTLVGALCYAEIATAHPHATAAHSTTHSACARTRYTQ